MITRGTSAFESIRFELKVYCSFGSRTHFQEQGQQNFYVYYTEDSRRSQSGLEVFCAVLTDFFFPILEIYIHIEQHIHGHKLTHNTIICRIRHRCYSSCTEEIRTIFTRVLTLTFVRPKWSCRTIWNTTGIQSSSWKKNLNKTRFKQTTTTHIALMRLSYFYKQSTFGWAQTFHNTDWTKNFLSNKSASSFLGNVFMTPVLKGLYKIYRLTQCKCLPAMS